MFDVVHGDGRFVSLRRSSRENERWNVEIGDGATTGMVVDRLAVEWVRAEDGSVSFGQHGLIFTLVALWRGYKGPSMNWLKWLLHPPETEVIDFSGGELPEPDPAAEAEYERMLAEFAAAGAPLDGHPAERIQANPDPYAPLLVDWLERSEHHKHWILQLLAVVPDPPGLTEALLREFGRFELPEHWRWSVGNALHDLNRTDLAPRLLPLATDPRQGMAAQMALIALGRARYAPALEPLIERLDDPELEGHAAEALRKLGDPAALPALEAMAPRSEFGRTARQRAIRALRR
ncbi:HEAT repeat domain-containing protein [Solirubrobacter sp. CPCC 204708]|uniref:HEAT repeat domain-containing protein n=1 Tax=Solirubrobacter deserti TaxID=2282478 RepID=A0ABT4RGG8_9ACTN|nr:HEAT repeat domain-containing protein [Solirubrobacter deserti]MBE2319632.1 HEAT repeat domain-containing protein [Solirubrobacter deserti]MDA0137629.1 HEAT repeat domain-containing protein [Solirubrobacter deserti]